MWTTSSPCGAGPSLSSSPDYALNWITQKWNTAHAFFSTCMGRPLLTIEIKDGETGKTVSRTTHALGLQDLRERGMVEEFTTAAERRRIGGRHAIHIQDREGRGSKETAHRAGWAENKRKEILC